MSLCAACGQPGHRYGRNEGMDRFDRQACINGLRGVVEAADAALRRISDFHRPHPDDDRMCIEGCGGGWPCSTRLEADDAIGVLG